MVQLLIFHLPSKNLKLEPAKGLHIFQIQNGTALWLVDGILTLEY